MSLAFTMRQALTAGRLDVTASLQNETYAVIGPNGSGKTRLLRALLGALPLTEGTIRCDDLVLYDAKSRIDAPTRNRHLGYVPQHLALLPHWSAVKNVAFAIACRHQASMRLSHREALHWLRQFDVEHLAGKAISKLSGGEQQRVALARAFASRPRALLLDEPLSALDVHVRAEVRSVIQDFLRRHPMPTLLVTHDALDVRVLASRVLVLQDGALVQSGTVEELVTNPVNDFVKAFFS